MLIFGIFEQVDSTMKSFVWIVLLVDFVLTAPYINGNQNNNVNTIEELIQVGKIPFPPPPSSLPHNSSFIPLLARLCDGQNPNCLQNVEWIVSVPKRPAQKACELYLKAPVDRILGGRPVELGEFPWMAALGYLNDQYNVEFNCGGTVISELYVMTAAHCTALARPPVVVRLGKTSLIDGDGIRPTNHAINDIIRHPSYSSITKRNDIALLRLGRRIYFTREISPACLQTDLSDITAEMKLLVTGWGSTSFDREIRSNVLLKTQLTSMPLPECNQTFLNYNVLAYQAALQDGISQGQYCAYDPTGRNDSCQGDSGGPLQYFPTSNSSVSTVVGIVSYGLSCGTALPGIYTRVAFYLDWIESIVWPNTKRT
ncbi:serine protease persephone-like [Contarinia nasturtii]|uniref:serine protease persephone-like n=1 Tax=Contarinia nasturtii TaxID=265458 RepID=UPI0012D4893F|nr:serine protease persephone-like [Contarinia nasturtii]